MAEPIADDLPELDLVEPAAKAPAVAAGTQAQPSTTDAHEIPPALIVVTQKQAQGACMRVAGLPAIDRLARQLLAHGHAQVIIASDGAHLPPLPDDALVKAIDAHDTASALDALRREMGRPAEFPADVVRPRDRDLTIGVRVHDEVSRRQAESAIFAEDARLRPPAVQLLLGGPASMLARWVLSKATIDPDYLLCAGALLGLSGCLLILSGTHVSLLTGLILASLQVIMALATQTVARVCYRPGVASARVPMLAALIDDTLDVVLLLSLAVGIGHRTASSRMVVLATTASMLFLAARVGAWLARLRVPATAAKPPATPRPAHGTRDAQAIFSALGHRSVFLPLWVALSLVGLHRLIVLYALGLGLTGMVQVVLRPSKRRS